MDISPFSSVVQLFSSLWRTVLKSHPVSQIRQTWANCWL